MNEELDSQLSAMFDDELPPAECELLARRLSRDEQLKARWGRYAIIGATIRAERGVMLQPRIAPRVSQALRAEPVLGESGARRARVSGGAWWQPVASVAVAAGVAAAAILWMRSEGTPEVALAPPTVQARPQEAQSPSVAYVVPRPAARREVVPSTLFANYLVAHFEVSSPVARQAMISDVLVGDRGTAGTQAGSQDVVPGDEMKDDVPTVEE
jgi:negative regulator of sigma E activity